MFLSFIRTIIITSIIIYRTRPWHEKGNLKVIHIARCLISALYRYRYIYIYIEREREREREHGENQRKTILALKSRILSAQQPSSEGSF